MKKTIEFTATPEEMADVFANDWSEFEQARFFEECERQFKAFGKNSKVEYQTCAISTELEQEGRSFVFRLANFCKASDVGDAHVDSLINHYPED